MINLLAPDDRRQLAAARTNTLLRRYVFLMALVIAVLIVEMVGVYLIIGNDKARNEAVIQENEQKTTGYAETKQLATQFKSDLATAKVILDKQVPYTKLITGVAAALPQDARLDTLALNPESFGTPTVLTIHTKSYGLAIDIKASLQKSPLFSDVSFQSVTKEEKPASDYQYTAVYNVTFSREALKQ
jgi:hypothetical protein